MRRQAALAKARRKLEVDRHAVVREMRAAGQALRAAGARTRQAATVLEQLARHTDLGAVDRKQPPPAPAFEPLVAEAASDSAWLARFSARTRGRTGSLELQTARSSRRLPPPRRPSRSARRGTEACSRHAGTAGAPAGDILARRTAPPRATPRSVRTSRAQATSGPHARCHRRNRCASPDARTPSEPAPCGSALETAPPCARPRSTAGAPPAKRARLQLRNALVHLRIPSPISARAVRVSVRAICYRACRGNGQPARRKCLNRPSFPALSKACVR